MFVLGRYMPCLVATRSQSRDPGRACVPVLRQELNIRNMAASQDDGNDGHEMKDLDERSQL